MIRSAEYLLLRRNRARAERWLRIAVGSLLPVLALAQSAVTPKVRYSAAVSALERAIRAEMTKQSLPALSIAVVEGRELLWAGGFGAEVTAPSRPATAETLYRIGSLSEVFIDVAVLQLSACGQIRLDDPVNRCVPEFQPQGRFGRHITVRELMLHRAGLVREPPVGHYFDQSAPSLKAAVESINSTKLVYRPATRTKYSNAGLATLAYLVERRSGKPFGEYVQEAILKPAGMTHSFVSVSSSSNQRVPNAMVWTYDGRTFSPPEFQSAVSPAISLCSTVIDLSKFVGMLFAGGHGENGKVLPSITASALWQPQHYLQRADLGQSRIIKVGSTAYGFSTELWILPDKKLGIILATNIARSNGALAKIAEYASRTMIAAKTAVPLPTLPVTEPISITEARSAAGRYGKGNSALDLMEQNGALLMLPASGGQQLRLRRAGPQWITDDRLGFGDVLTMNGRRVEFRGKSLGLKHTGKPGLPRKAWKGLIGEYGWEYDPLYILEKDGKLWSLIDFEYEPLKQTSRDEFRYPKRGLYDGETLRFKLDSSGRAVAVKLGGLVFSRRPLGPEDGHVFRITPVKPVADLRREALLAQPPHEPGSFRAPDLVDVTTLDATIKLDIRYATNDDFLSTPVYTEAKAFLQRPAAEALKRVSDDLRKQGYGLLVHDAYRPWYVTKMFWDATPEDKRIFVANPARGSRHNRGCAVDLTLYDLRTAKPVEMVGVYDEMSARSFPFYPGGTSRQRWLRWILRCAMESRQFHVYESEWWHFDFDDWQSYPILNQTFEQLASDR